MVNIVIDPKTSFCYSISFSLVLYNSSSVFISSESDTHHDLKNLCWCLKRWWHMALSTLSGSLSLGNKDSAILLTSVANSRRLYWQALDFIKC